MKLTSIRKTSLLLAAAALLSPLATASAEPEKPAPPAVDNPAKEVPALPIGDTHSKVMEDMLKAVNKMAEILATAKDEETAKAAAAKIANLEGPMKKITQRAEALGDPDKELEAKLMEKYEPKLTEAMGKMMKASMELSTKPELMKIMQPALDKIGGIMNNSSEKE